ncbi:hypothetical protein KI387_039574, partial [Taxus chinensis]
NEIKSGALMDLPGAKDCLKLFKADLCDEGSFDSAIQGCQGVFHVAGPMDFAKKSKEDFVETAVNGVVNVMEACTRAKSVSRVVFTSSVVAACPMNDKGEVEQTCVDERCWSPLNFLESQTSKLAWYATAKTLSEKEALKYGGDNKFEVVTVLPAVVLGPWFTATPPLSTLQTILALIGGNDEFYEYLKLMEFMLGSIQIVHIEDMCNAHILLMEHPHAQNRHVCACGSRSLECLKDYLAKHRVQSQATVKLDEEEDRAHAYLPTSSRKLLDMGFTYKYSLEESFDEGIECAMNNGILKL